MSASSTRKTSSTGRSASAKSHPAISATSPKSFPGKRLRPRDDGTDDHLDDAPHSRRLHHRRRDGSDEDGENAARHRDGHRSRHLAAAIVCRESSLATSQRSRDGFLRTLIDQSMKSSWYWMPTSQ